jgi:glycosyltransferase involved in cell wall biosynthesis
MIVKNEAPVIARCLASARPFIDHWIIVDTGSTDGTQQRVRECLEGIPGELHQRPWRDFSHNRNQALKLAGGAADYLLFIDADELLAGAPELRRTTLVADAYHLRCEDAGTSYARCALVAARLPWRWQGVVHEFLVCDRTFTIDTLAAPRIVVSHDGARSRDASTYLRDAALLEESVRGDPDNTRNVFYLAQSYRDAGDLERSRDWYARRAAMGGWDEEVWFALYQIALLEERIGCDAAVVSASYLRAFQYRPMRAEPLVQLARYHRLRGEHALAFVYAGHAATVPRPPDLLFVDEAVYAWRALDELSISAFYVGRHADGRAAVSTLLGDLRIPPAERSRILANAAFYGVTPRLQSIGESTPL